jgi:hypothetical protein
MRIDIHAVASDVEGQEPHTKDIQVLEYVAEAAKLPTSKFRWTPGDNVLHQLSSPSGRSEEDAIPLLVLCALASAAPDCHAAMPSSSDQQFANIARLDSQLLLQLLRR